MDDFPRALKSWRKQRRLSQLGLALEAQVSARHIAFLEGGRAKPSRAMVGRLGEALSLPLAARNHLLERAGFAARYRARAWDASAMAPIRDAVDHMLRGHAPYPGFALDRDWTITRLNAPAARLFGGLGLSEGASLLALLTSEALPARIENWPEVAHGAALRLRAESASRGGVEALEAAARALMKDAAQDAPPASPVLPIILERGGDRLAFFSTIARFGAPEDLALDHLQIELFFPADEKTKEALEIAAN